MVLSTTFSYIKLMTLSIEIEISHLKPLKLWEVLQEEVYGTE